MGWSVRRLEWGKPGLGDGRVGISRTADGSVGPITKTSVLLQRFPLAHQVPDFPHQRLVPVDHRFSRFMVIVKTCRRHHAFDLFDFGLALRDARLEFLDALAADILGLAHLPGLGFEPLLFVEGRSRLRRGRLGWLLRRLSRLGGGRRWGSFHSSGRALL